MGNPFRLFGARGNDLLRENDIDQLSVVFEISFPPICDGPQVRTTNAISQPDACTYARIADDHTPGCGDEFEPRHGHESAWTGSELLIIGGAGGTYDGEPLTSGLSWSPSVDEWTAIAPSPVGINYWPATHAAWVEDRLVLVGTEPTGEIRVLTYVPTTDAWGVSAPLREDRYGAGAVAISPTTVYMVGGSLNDPRDTAWSYDLTTSRWGQLPTPGIDPTEQMSGVWTGSEAIFQGGYSGPGPTAVVV